MKEGYMGQNLEEERNNVVELGLGVLRL